MLEHNYRIIKIYAVFRLPRSIQSTSGTGTTFVFRKLNGKNGGGFRKANKDRKKTKRLREKK